ncbi:MAG TPA: acyl-CoA dehydrogenase family protein [Streptosporangiaceae bacterium]|jgi:alkylation response protein AidB-like acyl-CoA dehydrogenase|nr:acyl-CoA dehydrogenase family protein [Streptosporangiaceae bacterium]
MSDDFRARARAWLEANAPHRAASDEEAEADTRGRAVVLAEQKAFQARLFDAGYAGITWPKEYGGQGLGSAEQIIWSQESRDYDLPTGAFFIGISMPGNTLVELGTEEQKKRYLPPMLRGEEIWCQLFSEPGAGSDVASLQTSAVRDGDEWVLNGQKVWTSGAQFSDYGAILARTDPTKPKHNGISMFIVDMHAPGVTVRPLKVATGHSPFNEVFFDNVRIPADALIGEENKGWDAAVVMLRHERIAIGTMSGSRTSPLAYDSLRDLAAGLGRTSDQGVRRDLAELYALGRATQLFATVLREEAQAGRMPGARGSVAKLAGSELGRFAGNVAADVLGDQLAGFDAAEFAAVTTAIIAAPGGAIAGGTSDIQRNIIGERVLGLAKDPGVDRATPFNQLRVGTQRQN